LIADVDAEEVKHMLGMENVVRLTCMQPNFDTLLMAVRAHFDLIRKSDKFQLLSKFNSNKSQSK